MISEIVLPWRSPVNGASSAVFNKGTWGSSLCWTGRGAEGGHTPSDPDWWTLSAMPVMLTQVQFPSFNRSEEPLTLGHWHELRVSRTAKNGILQVDKQKAVEGMAEVRRTSVPDDSWERGYCFLPVLETKASAQWLVHGLWCQFTWDNTRASHWTSSLALQFLSWEWDW